MNLAHDPELGTYAVEKGILVGLTAYSASLGQLKSCVGSRRLSSQKLVTNKMSDAPVLGALVSLLKGATTSHNESNCPMKPKVYASHMGISQPRRSPVPQAPYRRTRCN